MALLHVPDNAVNRPAYADLDFNNFRSINGLETLQGQKWTYLLSSRIRFNQQIEHAIRLAKPQKAQLCEWLEKIICSGQCSLLFVEELNLDELSLQRIKMLSENYRVTLVNLVVDNNAPENLVLGPWC